MEFEINFLEKEIQKHRREINRIQEYYNSQIKPKRRIMDTTTDLSILMATGVFIGEMERERDRLIKIEEDKIDEIDEEIEEIKERLDPNYKLEKGYKLLCEELDDICEDSAQDATILIELAKRFRELGKYKNTEELAKKCEGLAQDIIEQEKHKKQLEKENKYNALIAKKRKLNSSTVSCSEDYFKLEKDFREIAGDSGYKDAIISADECRVVAVEKHEEERKRLQSKQWEQQGLCRYDGGKLSLFKKKCKICGKKK